MAREPDGILTLPQPFGSIWGKWYVVTVRELVKRGEVGIVGFHSRFAEELEKHLATLPGGRDLELRLFEEVRNLLAAFTMRFAGKQDNKDRFLACCYNKWTPRKVVNPPIPKEVLAEAHRLAAEPERNPKAEKVLF